MNLRKDLCPDMATAERLYPLVLKRLQEYENFRDSQSEDTPEAVFDAEYKAMETYLSELTGKDLSEVWLWEWWEGEGIEVFAFRLALPEPKKVADFSKEEVLEVVHLVEESWFNEDDDWSDEDEENNDFAHFEKIFEMYYADDYYHKLLEINFPKTYDFKYFITQKDGSELTPEAITEKIWGKK
ncbi:MAG: hypothetical protein Q4C98_10340 [Capnocytophaga sp.]|nr:hypothetical protein [Capnocytophaga sp.]